MRQQSQHGKSIINEVRFFSLTYSAASSQRAKITQKLSFLKLP